MKAVILAGGKGTRLNLQDLPKPMAPFLGKPLLEHIINFLKSFGIRDIILCTGYMSDKIEEYFGDGREFGVNISYSVETEPLGTGGALKNIADMIDSTFILVNGDCLMDIDINSLMDFHKANDAVVSAALTPCNNPLQQELVLLDKERVVKFLPRNSKEHREMLSKEGNKFINAGIYVFEPEVFRYAPEENSFALEKDWFNLLLGEGKKFVGYYEPGCYIEIGNPKLYEEAQQNLSVKNFIGGLNGQD